MEEIFPIVGEDIGDVCRTMYHKLIDEDVPVTSLVNGVRIIMFEEERK